MDNTSIKFLIMDVDGTLTDGKIYMGNDGEIMKAFNIKDGYGITNLLPVLHIEPVILTGRVSEILKNRCTELHISKIYDGISNKEDALKQFIFSEKIKSCNIAYIGDDLNDKEAMHLCGLKACPADAVPEIRHICNFVSTYNGGDGAVRDFINFLYNNKG